MRRATIIGLTVAAAALAAPTGAAGASFAAGTDCQEQQSFVDGDPATVEARLPKRYTAMRNPATGRPLVFARGLRCREITLEGRTAPLVLASFGVLIESPDGRGCGSGAPGAGTVKGDAPPVCNWYVLRWLASDAHAVRWLRDGTPGVPAFHVPELVFDLGTFDSARNGTPLKFSAGGPAPFTIDALTRESPREIGVRGGYWMDTPQGTVKLALSSDDLRAADGDGSVRAPRGTEVAELMGAEERSYAPGYAAFASVHAGHGVYRKQILPPEGSKDGFSGSCSVKGTVHFDPPANNDSQQLAYSYTSSGTCSGTLDGREVEDAPVSLHHAGRSEGGCMGAKTIAPGTGAIEFAGGRVIRDTIDFTTTLTEASGTIYGERSGTAPVRGSFVTDRTPPDVTARCGGEGVVDTPLDLSFTTQSALIGEPPAPAARKRLRLSASPRSVHAGRATSFTFRVTGGDGQPRSGALVRFFGRRVRTGAAGTARIAATLHGHGAHRASAKLAGFQGARTSVLVRR